MSSSRADLWSCCECKMPLGVDYTKDQMVFHLLRVHQMDVGSEEVTLHRVLCDWEDVKEHGYHSRSFMWYLYKGDQRVILQNTVRWID